MLRDIWDALADETKEGIYNQWVEIAASIQSSISADCAAEMGMPRFTVELTVAEKILDLNISEPVLRFAKKVIARAGSEE